MSRQGLMNWTQEELIVFFTAVEAKQEQLFNSGPGLQNKAKVDAAWLEVGSECVAAGLQRFANRSVKQLRADLYQKKKMDVLRKIEKAKITGQPLPPWLPHEEIIVRLCQRNGHLDSINDIFDNPETSSHADKFITLEDLLPSTETYLFGNVEQEVPVKKARVEKSALKQELRASNGVATPRNTTPINLNVMDERTSLEIEILRAELQLKREELKVKEQEVLHKSINNYQLLTSLKMPAKIIVYGKVVYNEFYRQSSSSDRDSAVN